MCSFALDVHCGWRSAARVASRASAGRRALHLGPARQNHVRSPQGETPPPRKTSPAATRRTALGGANSRHLTCSQTKQCCFRAAPSSKLNRRQHPPLQAPALAVNSLFVLSLSFVYRKKIITYIHILSINFF